VTLCFLCGSAYVVGMELIFTCFFKDDGYSSDYAASNCRMNREYCIREDVEGSGRGLIQDSVMVFTWRD
jgi:hypothetical protein